MSENKKNMGGCAATRSQGLVSFLVCHHRLAAARRLSDRWSSLSTVTVILSYIVGAVICCCRKKRTSLGSAKKSPTQILPLTILVLLTIKISQD
jgi:hypothetical protein